MQQNRSIPLDGNRIGYSLVGLHGLDRLFSHEICLANIYFSAYGFVSESACDTCGKDRETVGI